MADSISQEEFRQQTAVAGQLLVLDVRRSADRDKAPATIGGAQWKDPASVNDWVQDIPKDSPVVVYCVRGGPVSQAVQKDLAAAGCNVRFLEGGLEGYK